MYINRILLDILFHFSLKFISGKKRKIYYMKFEDLIKLYEEKKRQYKDKTFEHISELLKEAKELHKKIGKNPPHQIKIMSNHGAHLRVKI